MEATPASCLRAPISIATQQHKRGEFDHGQSSAARGLPRPVKVQVQVQVNVSHQIPRRSSIRHPQAPRASPGEGFELTEEDMMELEFGRLLGEPQSKTLAKLMRKKVDPDANYVGLDKSSSNTQKDFMRIIVDENVKKRQKPKQAGSGMQLPNLAPPPRKPNSNYGKQKIQTVLSFTDTTSNNEETINKEKLDSYLRKPSFSQTHEISSPPKLAERDIKSRLARKEEETVESIGPGEDILRRPTLNETMENPNSDDLMMSRANVENHGVLSRRPKETKASQVNSDTNMPNFFSSPKQTSSEEMVQKSLMSGSSPSVVSKEVLVLNVDRPRTIGTNVSRSDSVDNDELTDPEFATGLVSGKKEKVHQKKLEPPVHVDGKPSNESKKLHEDSKALARHNIAEGNRTKAPPGQLVSLRKPPGSMKSKEDPVINQGKATVIEIDRPLQRLLERLPDLNQSESASGIVLDNSGHFTNELAGKENEEKEWILAEALCQSKDQEDVAVIGSNAAGLYMQFGSLVGFLPVYELSSKNRPHDFNNWARQNGYMPTQTKGNKTSNDDTVEGLLEHDDQNTSLSQDNVDGQIAVLGKNRSEILSLYNQTITKFLSAFVGVKLRVVIKSVNREKRRLRFSEMYYERENQEHALKKANLMENLKIGDVVSCVVKRITFLGVFVEVEGAPALIHRSEVSWNKKADPSSILTPGEVIEAKVCELDRFLQRISLSLKQMQPDPLLETLESLVEDTESSPYPLSDDILNQGGAEWLELKSLMKKLEEVEGIESISMGRRLRGTALATSFQVFLSAALDNGFKLLARSGNEVQEVLVQTGMDREKIKEIIRLSTFTES